MGPRRQWSEDHMRKAHADAVNGMSVRAAAKKWQVPKSTLHDRVLGRVDHGARPGPSSKFSFLEERELVKEATDRTDQGVGFQKKTFMRHVSNVAQKKGITFKNRKPSDKWWRLLKKRHTDFSLRQPEATSSIRHQGMGQLRIADYFRQLKDVFDRNPSIGQNPSRIWNLDETGFCLVHNPGRVIARKGSKVVQKKVGNSRQNITVIATVNAEGTALPAHVILPGKTQRAAQSYDLEAAAPGTSFSVSDKGWTKQGIALLYFEHHFLPKIGPARPQMLVMDGHGSHNFVELVECARKNNIVLVELPSHTSHWTQPLDRTVFKTVKTIWNRECDEVIERSGVPVGHHNFFRILGRVWGAGMVSSNITSGFRACGIYPYNPNAIPSVAYEPLKSATATVTTQSQTLPVSTAPVSSYYSSVTSTVPITPQNAPFSTVPVGSNNAAATVVVPTPFQTLPFSTVRVPDNNATATAPVPTPCQFSLASTSPVTSNNSIVMVPTVQCPTLAAVAPKVPSSSVSHGSPYPSQEQEDMRPLLDLEVLVEPGSSVVELPVRLDDSLDTSATLDLDTSLLSLLADVAQLHEPQPEETAVAENPLDIVEGALTPSDLVRYKNALESNVEIDEPMFATWTRYKVNGDQKETSSKRTSKCKQYFVQTCEEAYHQKIAKQAEKKLKQQKKEERKQKREAKLQQK